MTMACVYPSHIAAMAMTAVEITAMKEDATVSLTNLIVPVLTVYPSKGQSKSVVMTTITNPLSKDFLNEFFYYWQPH